MKKKMSRLFSGVLAAVMAVGMLPAYAELDVGADVDVVDNKGTSQAAVIDSAPAQFNVIVPTKLPFAILANNETLKATNAAIKNQGNGPVVLAGITAEGKGWAFADYDNVDFTKMPMNSKVFTMQLNGDKVPEAAVDTKVNVPITQSAWASGAEGSIYGKTDLPISYDGKFAPQADVSEEAVVAHVVFTVSWDIQKVKRTPILEAYAQNPSGSYYDRKTGKEVTFGGGINYPKINVSSLETQTSMIKSDTVANEQITKVWVDQPEIATVELGDDIDLNDGQFTILITPHQTGVITIHWSSDGPSSYYPDNSCMREIVVTP